MIAASEATQDVQANGDTRSLTLYHTHRGDQITVTYKRNGRYDSDGLKQLSTFLRDWRNNKSTRMEPKLFDIVWEVHRSVGRGGTVNIVSAYRSPETNAMLRARSRGVAKASQHMLGRAMDFYITGVPVSAVREAGVRLQRGGVGFYPTSGRPFVHLDAGSIRAWPRMSRSHLARLFPGGKTVHQPAEGGQMPGYQTAAAELRSRGDISLDSAYSGSGSSASGKSFFARLFGGGADESDDQAETQVAASAPARGAATSSAGGDDEGAAAAAPTRVATVRMAPMPMARPADMVRPSAAPAATQAEIVVAAAVPMPPVAPVRATQDAQIAMASAASVPLPPVAPTVVATKPVPLPTPAPSDGFALAAAGTDDDASGMIWRAGAQPVQGQPVGASEPGLALASAIPTPKPRSTPDSAIAVLAALPTPTASSEPRPREIDPSAAAAYQAEASTFPRIPDAFLGKKRSDESPELTLAYAAQNAELPGDVRTRTRAAVAPQTRVTASLPTDPNIRVLSPYSTPSAVYAAATASLRRRATLAIEALVSTPLDEAGYYAFTSAIPVGYVGEMVHPHQTAALIASPSAALVGGFTTDPNKAVRADRFSGSSVMLLRTQSFMPVNSFAGKGQRTHG